MPIRNKEIADKLNEVADLLDIKGENDVLNTRSWRQLRKLLKRS